MKHTKEPWSAEQPENANGWWILCDSQGQEIGSCDGGYEEEDAKRIVACINACEGLTNEQLESGYIQKLIIENNIIKKMLLELSNSLNDIKIQAG